MDLFIRTELYALTNTMLLQKDFNCSLKNITLQQKTFHSYS